MGTVRAGRWGSGWSGCFSRAVWPLRHPRRRRWPLRPRRRCPRPRSRHRLPVLPTSGSLATGPGVHGGMCGCRGTGRCRPSPATCGRPVTGRRAVGATCGSKAAGGVGRNRVRLGRRQFLGGARRPGGDGAHRTAGEASRSSAEIPDLSLHAGRRVGLSAARRRRAVDAAGAVAAQPGGGMPPDVVVVDWEVASDERMRPDRATRHAPRATPAWAHSVHVEVDGLEPGRWYWYRFRAGGRGEPGRPHAHRARPPRAPSSGCGSRSPRASSTSRATSRAYRHMAEDDLDLVVFLGDYIYESSWGQRPRAPARRRRSRHARRLPQPLRAVQDRSRPAARARRAVPGSSPGTITRSTTTTPTTARSISIRDVPAAARRRLPGVLRAHAAAARASVPHGPYMRL